jgi:hypothetical protein
LLNKKAIETSKKKLREIFELESEYSAIGKATQKKKSSLVDTVKSQFKEIFEVIYYLIDFFKTLNNLLKVHPKLTEFVFDQKLDR